MYDLIDRDDPKDTKSNKDNALPILEIPNTETEDPNLENDRKDKELTNITASKHETQLPNLAIPNSDKLDPALKNALTENVEASEVASRTE